MTVDEARNYRRGHNPFDVVYPIYHPELKVIDRVARNYSEFTKDDESKGFKIVNSSNSIHCPRWVYLAITPDAQLSFFLDDYIVDEKTLQDRATKIRVDAFNAKRSA